MQDNLNDFYLAPITTFNQDFEKQEFFKMSSPPGTPLKNREQDHHHLKDHHLDHNNINTLDNNTLENNTLEQQQLTFNLSPPLTIHGSPDLQYGDVYQEGYEYDTTQPMYQFMHGSMDPQHLEQAYEDFVPAYNSQIQQLRHSQSEVSLNSWASPQPTQGGFDQHHLQSEWQPEATGTFKCTFPGCHKVFSKQTNLKSHSRIHHTERNYSCDDCGSSFRRSHDLKRHQRSLHSDVKPFPCQKCAKRFSRMDALKRHTSRLNSPCFSKAF